MLILVSVKRVHLEDQGLCWRYKNLCDSSGELVINQLGNFM